VPIHYAIDSAIGVVYVDMSGAISPAEVLMFLERLAVDPGLRPAMPQFIDTTRVHAPPSIAESEAVAQGFARLRHRFEGARCAVLVAEALMYGAIRQFAALAARASVGVRPFLDAREAQDWLGLPNDVE
jgi:hypothetical protein